jgi:hypothetical protein
MPVVVREEIKNLERELGNQAAALIRLLATRPRHNAQEGEKPGAAGPTKRSWASLSDPNPISSSPSKR